MSIVNSTSSYVWLSVLSFKFYRTKSTSCCTRTRAFALIPCIEYDVVFPSIFVNSFILGPIEDGSSCATILLTFSGIALPFQGFVLQSQIHHLFVWRRIALHLQHLRRMLWLQWALFVHLPGFWDGSSVTIGYTRERKSATVLTESTRCAILTLNCITHLHAFHKDGGIASVWKNRVTDLSSFRTIVSFVVYDKLCASSRNSM